jgi:signal transduction histidine kinase
MLRHFLALIASGLAVALIAGAAFNVARERTMLRETFTGRAQFAAKSVGDAFSALLCQGKLTAARALLATDRDSGYFELARVVVDGKALALEAAPGLRPIAELDPLEHYQEFDQRELFMTFADLPQCKGSAAQGEISIGYSFRGLSLPLKKALSEQLEILAGELVGVALAFFALHRFLRRRIAAMASRAELVVSGDLRETRDAIDDPEFAILAEKLNSLARNLAEAQREGQVERMALVTEAKAGAYGEVASSLAGELTRPVALLAGKAAQIEVLATRADVNPLVIARHARSILEIASRLKRVANGLASFTPEGAEAMRLARAASIVHEACAVIRPRFTVNKAELRVAVMDPNLRLECQVGKVVEILVGLLENALDATVGYKTRWVTVACRERDAWVEIVVTDSGTGLSEHVLSNLGRPFFTTKRRGQGRGLGLSVAMEIAREHGGNLAYDPSSPNTCFVLRMPRPTSNRRAA